jgi:hypothetical protein
MGDFKELFEANKKRAIEMIDRAIHEAEKFETKYSGKPFSLENIINTLKEAKNYI